MFEDWSPERAEALACRAGLRSLGEWHWKVIAAAREDAARSGRVPQLFRIQEITGLAAGELERLFPGDAGALITRIAGFERPASAGRAGSMGDLEED